MRGDLICLGGKNGTTGAPLELDGETEDTISEYEGDFGDLGKGGEGRMMIGFTDDGGGAGVTGGGVGITFGVLINR